MNETPILLASGSPRRRELLQLGGVHFQVMSRPTDETLPDSIAPWEAVLFLARQKGRAVREACPHQAVLSADTVVALEGRILGKPRDEQQAEQMLSFLSGKTHQVYTGVCVFDGHQEHVFYEKTDVTFWSLTEEEIRAYVKTGEPMDKAGAYGIQGKGALLVERICGDYFNVVGLPLSKTVRLLKQVVPACLPDEER